jgi:hypothetical protein
MKTQISGGRCGCCQRQLKPFTILLPVGATGGWFRSYQNALQKTDHEL